MTSPAAESGVTARLQLTELEPQQAWPTLPAVHRLHLRDQEGRGPSSLLAREGQGDNGSARWIRQPDGTYRHQMQYKPRRNGLPEPVPYVYGASVGSRAWGQLDLEAIALADYQAEHPAARRRYRQIRISEPQPVREPELWRTARPRGQEGRPAAQPAAAPRAPRKLRPADVSRIRQAS